MDCPSLTGQSGHGCREPNHIRATTHLKTSGEMLLCFSPLAIVSFYISVTLVYSTNYKFCPIVRNTDMVQFLQAVLGRTLNKPTPFTHWRYSDCSAMATRFIFGDGHGCGQPNNKRATTHLKTSGEMLLCLSPLVIVSFYASLTDYNFCPNAYKEDMVQFLQAVLRETLNRPATFTHLRYSDCSAMATRFIFGDGSSCEQTEEVLNSSRQAYKCKVSIAQSDFQLDCKDTLGRPVTQVFWIEQMDAELHAVRVSYRSSGKMQINAPIVLTRRGSMEPDVRDVPWIEKSSTELINDILVIPVNVALPLTCSYNLRSFIRSCARCGSTARLAGTNLTSYPTIDVCLGPAHRS
ncbi:hypothetical protein SprV_0100445600 [Sparganum proliferum]